MANEARQFVAAAREAAGNDSDTSEQEPLLFYIGDKEVEVSYPGTGQLTYLASISSSTEDDIQRWGGFINFIAALMSDQDARVLKHALIHNEVDMTFIADMVEEIMETWSARPTMKPSGSSRQPRATGRQSTGGAQKRASTRSPSRSAGS